MLRTLSHLEIYLIVPTSSYKTLFSRTALIQLMFARFSPQAPKKHALNWGAVSMEEPVGPTATMARPIVSAGLASQALRVHKVTYTSRGYRENSRCR